MDTLCIPPFYQATPRERAQSTGELLTPLSAESPHPGHPIQPPTTVTSGIGFQPVIALNTTRKPMQLNEPSKPAGPGRADRATGMAYMGCFEPDNPGSWLALSGNASTRLYVDSDFDGTVSSHDSPSLFSLCVSGFARHESIHSISSIGYTLFNAGIGRSDVPAELYSDGTERRVTKKGNSYSRWCVLQQQ